MTLATYIAASSRFSAAEAAALNAWHASFAVDDAWRLIRRNVDRECDRSDIDTTILDEYLSDIASRYTAATWDPVVLMDLVLDARRSHFLLPGQPLPLEGTSLSRVMRVDHLMKFQLYRSGVPILRDISGVIRDLQSGALTGRDLEGSNMGRADRPLWTTRTADIASATSADSLRNRLGLKHVEHGHLVELVYPDSWLAGHSLALRAPTFLDGIAAGADNWIFVKRSSPGGPDWGHAIDLRTSGHGAPEAVHRDFHVTSARSPHIGLNYRGQVANSPPQVDFATLLKQT
jgi:hypothetical protein